MRFGLERLVAEHRPELERLGWVVKLVEGFGEFLDAQPKAK